MMGIRRGRSKGWGGGDGQEGGGRESEDNYMMGTKRKGWQMKGGETGRKKKGKQGRKERKEGEKGKRREGKEEKEGKKEE